MDMKQKYEMPEIEELAFTAIVHGDSIVENLPGLDGDEADD